jgi:prepilin-type N-terminal cleavage/methylation domain-containing protein
MKMRKGFTLLELLVTLGILLIFLAMAFPLYERNVSRRAVQSAARYFESLYQNTKQRSIALGSFAGICLGGSTLQVYAFHPLVPGAVSFKPVVDLSQMFHASIKILLVSSVFSGTSGGNPCPSGTTQIQLSPYPNDSNDWQGSILFSSDQDQWQVKIQNGVITDGP